MPGPKVKQPSWHQSAKLQGLRRSPRKVLSRAPSYATVILSPQQLEAVKKSKTGIFIVCNPLKIQVGARHGVPLRRFFHSFLPERRGGRRAFSLCPVPLYR